MELTFQLNEPQVIQFEDLHWIAAVILAVKIKDAQLADSIELIYQGEEGHA